MGSALELAGKSEASSGAVPGAVQGAVPDSGRGGLFGRGLRMERRRQRAEGRAYAVGVSVKAAPSPFNRTKVAVFFYYFGVSLVHPWRILGAPMMHGISCVRGERFFCFSSLFRSTVVLFIRMHVLARVYTHTVRHVFFCFVCICVRVCVFTFLLPRQVQVVCLLICIDR